MPKCFLNLNSNFLCIVSTWIALTVVVLYNCFSCGRYTWSATYSAAQSSFWLVETLFCRPQQMARAYLLDITPYTNIRTTIATSRVAALLSPLFPSLTPDSNRPNLTLFGGPFVWTRMSIARSSRLQPALVINKLNGVDLYCVSRYSQLLMNPRPMPSGF